VSWALISGLMNKQRAPTRALKKEKVFMKEQAQIVFDTLTGKEVKP
jgi:hypothetical protein